MTMADNNENKVLNVPPIRFPEFSGEWTTSLLSNFLTENKERNQKGTFDKTDVLSVSGDYGIVNQIELLGRSFAGASVLPYHVVRHGNIVYTKSPLKEYPYGIVKANTGTDGIVSTLYAVYNVKDNANAQFVEYYFSLANRTNRYFKPIVRIGAKHDMKIGNHEVLVNKVTFPDLEEQTKIASLLQLIDERIATQTKIIEDLKKLKSAIIEKHYKQADKQYVRFSDLGSPFNVSNLSKEDLSDSGTPCVFYGELFTTYGAIINEVVSHTKKSKGMTLSQKGDLLFPSSTTVDAISLIAPSVINIDNVILGGDMFGIHVAPNNNAQYLSYYFNNHIAKRRLAKYAKGSTIIHLHYTDIEKTKLLLPRLDEQNKMAKCLVSLDDKINIENSILNLQNSQKAYLLSQMFI